MTSKPPGEGVGLGSRFPSSIIRDFGGALRLLPPNAARILRWNCAARLRIEPETRMPSTIVLIDDDEEVLEALAETFRLGGYPVEACSSLMAAREQLKREADIVVVTDVRMPRAGRVRRALGGKGDRPGYPGHPDFRSCRCADGGVRDAAGRA